MNKASLWAAATVALLLAACAGETGLPQATGKGTVRAIHAIRTGPAIAFLVEERSIGTLDYKGISAADDWDDLEYNFNFEVVLAGDDQRTRIASRFIDVVADTDYTLVLSGDLAAPDLTLWEAPVRSFEDTEAVFEARFGHAAPSSPAVDVYFAEPGVPPAAGQAIGTIAFGEVLAPADYPEGEYVLTLTGAGDPGDVIFTSDPLTPALRGSFTFAIFEPDANDLGPVAVQLLSTGGGSSKIADADIAPTVQFIHASTALATADIYIEDNGDALTDPDVEGHAFRDITAELPVFDGANFLTYTTPGDTAAILLEAGINVTPGTRNRFIVGGDIDNLGGVLSRIDRRSVETYGRLSIVHTAINHPAVDIYIVERDAGIENAAPVFVNVIPGGAPRRSDLIAADFDLYITPAGDRDTVIAGPYALDVATGDVIDLITFDNVTDPAIADIVAIP